MQKFTKNNRNGSVHLPPDTNASVISASIRKEKIGICTGRDYLVEEHKQGNENTEGLSSNFFP